MANKVISNRPRGPVDRLSRYQKRAFLKAFGSEQVELDDSRPLRSRTLPRNERGPKIQRRTQSGQHTG